MSHLALVRAEIKSWERDFAARHGRDPSVQDIRDQPAVADKYKLYKKLSKADPRLPAPKSRPADPVHPLPGFNPFSPVKKPTRSPRPNPFATPTKNKSRPRPRTPSPSPSTPPHAIANASSSHGPAAAVSRARKRLRGEPVSPSPNKPKRQRIRSQASLPFPRLDLDSSSSEQEVEQELPQCDFNSSFVVDSPVKAPAGGKSFKVLFDDALPALPIATAPDSTKPHRDLKSKVVTSGPEHRLNRTHARLSAQIFPTKDLPAPSHKPTFKSAISQPKTSNKRALDDNDLVPPQPSYPLIPPSPPQDLLARDAGRGKAKSTTGRKRLRVDQGSDDGEDSPDDFSLKVVAVSLDRKHRHAGDEWDPSLHLRTRNHDSAAEGQTDANHHASGTFSVDLPDKFRRVLAISPPRTQNSTEERFVRGVLYGDRVGHYDPSRGGNIWDAGETDDGTLGDAETEDDWEGEPVPWEVGEL